MLSPWLVRISNRPSPTRANFAENILIKSYSVSLTTHNLLRIIQVIDYVCVCWGQLYGQGEMWVIVGYLKIVF